MLHDVCSAYQNIYTYTATEPELPLLIDKLNIFTYMYKTVKYLKFLKILLS